MERGMRSDLIAALTEAAWLPGIIPLEVSNVVQPAMCAKSESYHCVTTSLDSGHPGLQAFITTYQKFITQK